MLRWFADFRISVRTDEQIDAVNTKASPHISLLRRGFCLLKNRGKEGKTEKRERRKKRKGGKKGKAEKAREKGKSEESLCQISVEIWQKLSISDRTQPECRLSFS